MAPRALVLVPILLTVAACGGAATSNSPRGTLVALNDATRRGDLHAVYALLPAAAQRAETYAQFESRMRGEQSELRELAGNVQRGLDAQREPVLQVPMRAGGTVPIVDDPEGWRIAEPAFGPSLAASPGDAARALRAALVRQSLPELLQVLSSRARGALQAEIAAMVEALENPADLESPTTSPDGQRREYHLPDGRTLVLVREGNYWRVDGVQ